MRRKNTTGQMRSGFSSVGCWSGSSSRQPGVWIVPILLSTQNFQSASQVQAHVFLPPPEGFNPDRISILQLQEHSTNVGCPENKAGGIRKAQLKTTK